MRTLSFRIDEKEDKELDNIAKKMKTDKSTVARKAIELGIKNLKKIEAFENIRIRKWTIWKAAEYCGESYRSFLRLLREENIPFPLSTEELEREFHENSSE
ncbi:MAG: ribbon-helix-helix protein, CopG family [Promethearchaeota archaeon]|nr:MAG: ribbon-helix-helix protein, CopG family [Candidatus Lokiarchaeota archaeon]